MHPDASSRGGTSLTWGKHEQYTPPHLCNVHYAPGSTGVEKPGWGHYLLEVFTRQDWKQPCVPRSGSTFWVKYAWKFKLCSPFLLRACSDCPLSLPHRSCGKPKIQRAFCSPVIWHRLLLKAEGKSVVCQTYGELRKAIQTQSEAFVATCGQLWKQSRPSIHWFFCSVWPVPSLLLSSATVVKEQLHGYSIL